MCNRVLWLDSSAQREFEQSVTRNGSVNDLTIRLLAGDGAPVDGLTAASRVDIHDEPHVLWVLQDITERKRTEEELMAAIDAVMADTSWFSRQVVERLASMRELRRPYRANADLDTLTNRERDMLNLICAGLSNAEISRELNLSPHTIRNHISALYLKIGVSSRAQAVIWGRERGITASQPLKHKKPRS